MIPMQHVWLTGASGYLGANLAAYLRETGVAVRAVGREMQETAQHAEATRSTSSGATTWIHAAGVATRIIGSHAADEALGFASRSAQTASSMGIPRIILCSSIYARLHEEGEASPYGEHKCAVERVFAEQFEGELVILRLPPLYGGRNDRSSVATLAALTARGFPLPLGKARAPRSYLSVRNFAQLVRALIDVDPAAPGARRVFEPSDGLPISTRDLVGVLAQASGKPIRTIAFPELVMRALGKVTGKQALVAGAFGALEARDGFALREYSGWIPSESTAQAVTAAYGRNT